MKSIKYIPGFIIAIAMLVTSCEKKEAPLTSSNINEFGYIVPQGNNNYDQRIVNYYNRYGVYMLYKFTARDAYWTITKWDSAYRVIPAEENYVNKQLDLIDSTFFRYYPDSTLRKLLPVKFLLCSSIQMNGAGLQVDGYLTGSNTTGWNYETFLANWGSSRINNIIGTKDSAVLFRGNINYGFLRMLDLKAKVGRSDIFAASSDYVTAFSNTLQSTKYTRGFLTTAASTSNPGALSDWLSYIQAIVQNPYSYLTNASGITPTNNTMQGILTPVKDSSGLIRKKYDAILNYYLSNHNIDLQRIGDGRP